MQDRFLGNRCGHTAIRNEYWPSRAGCYLPFSAVPGICTIFDGFSVFAGRPRGKLLGDLLDYARSECGAAADDKDMQACRRTVSRLIQDGPVPELDALTAVSDDRDFEAVAKAVREAIRRTNRKPGSIASTRSSSNTCGRCANARGSP